MAICAHYFVIFAEVMYLDEGENITRFAIKRIFMGTAVSLVLKLLMVFVDG